MADVQGDNAASTDFVTDLAYTVVYPFALRAAIVLRLPDIIDSEGPGAALSAKEICAHLPNPETNSPENLEKILEVLSCRGLFSSSVDDSLGIRKYGLTALSKSLVPSGTHDDWFMILSAPEMVKVWPNMHESVLNPEKSAFERCYGKGLYPYLKQDAPDLSKRHVSLMEKVNALQLEALLEHYADEFKAFTGRLVDVGGSHGSAAAAIAAKYPNIECVVNFDLPDVVSSAPAIPRVEHVGGSCLEFVPEGDMMFMKFLMINFNDGDAAKLMKNCYKALPAKGKMIIVDKVKVDTDNPTARLRMAEQNVVTSLMVAGGKTRTLKDVQAITESAGFTGLRIVKTIGDTVSCMEICKE